MSNDSPSTLNGLSSPDSFSEDKMILKETLKALLSKIITGTLIQASEFEDGFELAIPLPEERSQKVYITVGRRDADGENLFQIFTICDEASPEVYEIALRMNMDIDYGALAIHELYGRDYLVMVDTQLVRTAQPAEIEKSVLTLAEVGDDLEKLLTSGQDLR